MEENTIDRLNDRYGFNSVNDWTIAFCDVVHYANIFAARYQAFKRTGGYSRWSVWRMYDPEDIYKQLAFSRMKLMCACAAYKFYRQKAILGG